MKEGLGDILYFLAMIAFFVISAIVKSKKAKKNAVPPSEPSGQSEEGHRSSGFPWLDDVFRDEEEELSAEEEVKPAPVFEGLASRRDATLNIQKKEPVKREMFKYSEVEGSEFGGSYWDEEEFDLERAIIFSEILKRPEL